MNSKKSLRVTFEVEMGDERYKVIISEHDLSVRQPGSNAARRIAWLDVLRLVLQSSPGSPAESSQAKGIADACLREFLKPWEKYRKFHEQLQPGASEDKLQNLEHKLGKDLPTEVRMLLTWHNGQKRGSSGLFDKWFFMSSDDIIATCKKGIRVASGVDAWSDGFNYPGYSSARVLFIPIFRQDDDYLGIYSNSDYLVHVSRSGSANFERSLRTFILKVLLDRIGIVTLKDRGAFF